ncbi:MAG: DUF4139 domain-containing protein [Spirochaetaceae bacterium]|nr:DUF4139 domain-containing protein [Spirochaetaceae bacterium]
MRKWFWVLFFLTTGLPCLFSQAAAEAAPGERLPVKSVVLFTSGVGYFSREGTVTDSGSIELLFDVKNVSDLLKSMVVRDLDGGAILGVEYASREPLERTLKGFSLDLSGAPGFAQLVQQARGEMVTITADKKYEGAIVGTEERIVSGAEGTLGEEVFITLFGPAGLESIPLKSVRSLQFQNPRLRDELEAALKLISETRNTEKKSVLISHAGKGRRRVQAGYIVEAPVWKTSYRLVVGGATGGKHLLQGWGIVENATDEDWKGVRLDLVSGMPVSFAMDLYRPLFNPRPVLPYSLQGALAPQTYDMGFRPEGPAGIEGHVPPPPAQSRARMEKAAAPMIAEEMAYEPDYRDMKMEITKGVEARATGEAAGEFFRYTIASPVDLKRRQSAMIPILNEEIEGERLSIYNGAGHAKHPMNGLRLKNTSVLSLMGGPLTVYEDGLYAGDAYMDKLAPGAERLVSYSLDLSTEVMAEAANRPELISKLRLQRGILTVSKVLRREKTYTLINRDPAGLTRRIIVEHPAQADWKLAEPETPAERTDSLYRFQFELPAGRDNQAAFLVAEERLLEQTVGLSNINNDTILFYMQQKNISPAVRTALEKLSAMKNELAGISRQRQTEESRLTAIHKEQERIRANMDSLERTSPLYQRYAGALNDQENTLAELTSGIDGLRRREAETKKAIDDYLAALDVE